jgi:hypothetical protein
LLCTLISFSTVASARNPVDYLEVVAVTPTRVIEHEVDLKGQFDKDAEETFLEGPHLFSHAVGLGKEAVHDENTFLNWYKIAKPATEPRRVLSVRDSMRGDDAHRITIANSAFLLAPTQRITTGRPARIPSGLNYFKAYEIVDGAKLSQKVKLRGAMGPSDRTAVKARYLCVPVEKRHHDEHFPIKSAAACLMVYELLPQKCRVNLATIDLFGLNKLEARSTDLLCVPAQIAKDAASTTD